MGAHWDGQGLNIAVHSVHAHAIELCLFNADGTHETHRGALPGHTVDVFHAYLPAQALPGLVAPGLLYGLRAHGPWRPDRGHLFNPRKLLLDPNAREIVGHFDHGPQHFGYDGDHPLQPDPRDNAATALKARLVHDAPFDWGDDRPPHTPLAATVIGELHVKGFTRRHPAVPEALRGTYAGLAHPAAIAHLRALGITAVSLLPVQHKLSEPRLVAMGLSNYWGYNTLGFFCPEPTLAANAATARQDFKQMVQALHAAGIEVLLDVVYNHTAEGDALGPTLCWRGLDNADWYSLHLDRHGHHAGYDNHTGCGNTVALRHPAVLQWVLDSLRHWVTEFHVDGFRFDLAPVLARGAHGFERDGPFFRAVQQDPVLGRLLAAGKLIAEPWDIGPGGYQAGHFPRGWLEWNDGFRDTVRAWWLGGPVTRGQLAQRLAGSSDRLQAQRRTPGESVNYVVSHDGFTLRDLVSYNQRHNLANGEQNRDGHGHNLSWNCGAEGDTTDATVLALRQRLQRALLATLLLAQGTPMLALGDEQGHSQGGNNNPYCQDNPTTWIDWASADPALLAFTQRLVALRRQWLPLGPHWYSGVADAHGWPDLGWLRRNGLPLGDWDWNQATSRVLGALIGLGGHGQGPLLLLLNAEASDTPFALPLLRRPARPWQVLLDTSDDAATGRLHSGHCPLAARSVVLLVDVAAVAPPAAA
jgi:glycogen operon protein